jgi:Domain of unknown function (DUF3470)
VAKGEPPADAEAFDGRPDKFEKYFSPKPGQNDGPSDQPKDEAAAA